MAKKSFMNKDNPAMQFISAPAAETETEAAVPVTAPAPAEEVMAEPAPRSGSKDIFIPPRSGEHKTKRAQLLMTPSLHEKVVKKAVSLNMSFNEFVNLLLEKYVQ